MSLAEENLDFKFLLILYNASADVLDHVGSSECKSNLYATVNNISVATNGAGSNQGIEVSLLMSYVQNLISESGVNN